MNHSSYAFKFIHLLNVFFCHKHFKVVAIRVFVQYSKRTWSLWTSHFVVPRNVKTVSAGSFNWVCLMLRLLVWNRWFGSLECFFIFWSTFPYYFVLYLMLFNPWCCSLALLSIVSLYIYQWQWGLLHDVGTVGLLTPWLVALLIFVVVLYILLWLLYFSYSLYSIMW